MSLKNKAAAIGIGELKPLKEPGEGTTALGLMAKVAAEAIADAGLEKKDIDGFLVGMPFNDPGMLYPAAAAEVLGVSPRMLNIVDIGGASPAGNDVAGGSGDRRRDYATRCCAWPRM